MLAGGGAVITTDTGGIGEAVGDHAIIVPVDDPDAIAAAIDAALALPPEERAARAERARAHALQFDRASSSTGSSTGRGCCRRACRREAPRRGRPRHVC